MSNRSLLEFNHDHAPPRDDAALLAWARQLRNYLGAAQPEYLPPGVVQKHYRHHSEPCLVEAAREAVKDIASRANAYVAKLVR